MKLTDLIKQLKREYKSGGEMEIEQITISPDGRVIIGGTFESGPVQKDKSILEQAAEDDLSKLTDIPKRLAKKDNPYETD